MRQMTAQEEAHFKADAEFSEVMAMIRQRYMQADNSSARGALQAMADQVNVLRESHVVFLPEYNVPVTGRSNSG